MHQFLCLFSRFFSLSLINQFDYNFPRNGFLCIYPSWIYWSSWICKCISFSKFEIFSALISSKKLFPCFTLPLLSFWNSSYTKVRSFDIVSLTLEVMYKFMGFYFPFFSFFFRLDNFYGSIFKFTDSFLYHLHSTLEFLYYFIKCFWYCIFQFKEFNL